jgi:disulfide bond formation protein DsbB
VREPCREDLSCGAAGAADADSQADRTPGLIVVLIFIIQNPHAVNISFLGACLWLLLAVALLLAAVGAAHAGRRVNLAAPPHRPIPITVLEFSTLAQRQLIEQEIAELNAPRPGQPPDTPSEAWPGNLCRPGS